MTDLVDRPDLVPPNDDRPVTTAIVAVDGRLDDSNMLGITILKEVDETEVEFLPFLGWEDSVDVWDESWPEATKRAVIEAAPIVHRHKGTRYAVETALRALGVKSDIIEWWQVVPRRAPYTFTVTAIVTGRLYDGPILDVRLIRAIQAAVLAAKPESRAFSLDIAAGTTGALGIAPVVTPRARVSVSITPRPGDFFAASLGMAPVAVARQRVALSMYASAQ